MGKNVLSDLELRRFHLQMNLPGIGLIGQEKIKAAKVAVIGSGGTGASVLQYLASVGVGSFGIIDDTLVEESNIQSQTLYGGADLGKLKTIISRQRLQTIYPLSEYEIINLRLNSENIEKIIKPYSVIIDATNNTESGLLINDACIKLGKYWVYGSVSGYDIKVTVFNYTDGPSYRCFLANNVSSYSNEIIGNISIAHGFAGILIASESIKLITENPDIISGKMFSFNMTNFQSKFDQIQKIPEYFQPTSA
jgi:sulfur-carrier protein adenylyltransferase/sulfurtransferase